MTKKPSSSSFGSDCCLFLSCSFCPLFTIPIYIKTKRYKIDQTGNIKSQNSLLLERPEQVKDLVNPLIMILIKLNLGIIFIINKFS